MATPPEGAVRKRRVPEELVGATKQEVLDWARGQLNGEEPNLTESENRLIRAGELHEVLIRPRKAGFFLPTGEFVEAFDTTLRFGEDISAHEKEWDATEADWGWADQENRLFNKETVVPGPNIGQQLWEHGKRIAEYAAKNNRSPSGLLHLLDRRKTASGYGRRTHQTSLDFYRWKPAPAPGEGIFMWSWERVDAVLRFSSQDAVRNAAADFLALPEFGGIFDRQVTRLLARKQRSVPRLPSVDDETLLESVRQSLKRGEIPDALVAKRVREILEKA